MHLVHCATPQEPLEDAPRSALLADLTDGEQWDGFWSSLSDAYYVRCTRHSGVTEWFQLADEVATTSAAAPVEPRVLPFRRARNQSRVEFVIARSPNGQRMLVGSARRTPR